MQTFPALFVATLPGYFPQEFEAYNLIVVTKTVFFRQMFEVS